MYSSERLTAGSNGQPSNKTYALMPHHPEALTHVLTRYITPRIPKALYTSLTIPTDDWSSEDKDAFAAVFLANYTSDRSESRLACRALPTWSPWAEYLAWKDSGEREVKSSMCLLQRLHDYSTVVAERSKQCKARRFVRVNDDGDPQPTVAPFGFDDDSDDDYDYDLDVVTPDMMEAEMATLTEGLGARGSLAGALQFFGPNFPSPVSTTPLGGSCIQAVDIKKMSSAATERNKHLSGVCIDRSRDGSLQLKTNDDGTVSALLLAVARRPAEPVITLINMNDPDEFASMFTPLKEPPSIADTIALFTLAHGQAQMFVLLATEMDEVIQKRRGVSTSDRLWFADEPLRLLVLGPPGTGKTRVQLAFQWYAYQRGLHDEIMLTAYPHKAAALLNSPVLTANTTCALMGINPMTTALATKTHKAFAKSQKLLHDGRWLIMDEASFYSQATLSLTSRSLQQHALFINTRAAVASYFGTVTVVLTGDLTQHNAPTGKPLTSGASRESIHEQQGKPDIRGAVTGNTIDSHGREAFKSFENVIILDKQQRMKDDPSFAAITATFASEDPVTPQQIDDVCRLVNASVPASIDLLLHRNPRLVVTRNDIRNHASRALDIKQVRTHRTHILITWFSSAVRVTLIIIPPYHRSSTIFDHTLLPIRSSASLHKLVVAHRRTSTTNAWCFGART